MTEFRITADLAERAVLSPRFEILGKIGLDMSTVGTWNPRLSRRNRILVPVDVQAYVVPDDGVEETVPLTGRQQDPPPFTVGTARPPGVHLHWAMPDALLAGGHDESTQALSLPRLPDTWAVIRALQPVGGRSVLVHGWVVDAPTASVTPLATYVGEPGVAAEGTPTFDPLDGASDGPSWTASYTASVGRFGFHDPLTDLDALAGQAPDGFARNQAVYTVCGWWRDPSQDPLSAAVGAAGLDRVLESLGWRVDHDEDDGALARTDPRVTRLKEQVGLDAPSDEPHTKVVGTDGRTISGALDGTSFAVAYPVSRAGSVIIGDALPRYDSLLHGSVLGVPVDGKLPAADDRPEQDALRVAVGADIDDLVSSLGASVLAADPASRRAAEDVVAAFSAGLMSRLGTTDGLDDLGQREHENGFWSLPGAAVPGARSDRLRSEDTLAAGPMTVGRKGRAGSEPVREPPKQAKVGWRQTFTLTEQEDGSSGSRRKQGTPPPKEPESRQVHRPAPRYYRPQPMLIAVRGAHPSHRHHDDGLYDDSGRMLCRYPGAVVTGIDAVVDGATVLPTLGSGAVPAEVLTVVREAVLLNPYAQEWLAAAGAPARDQAQPFLTRVKAEMVRLYGVDGVYDGGSHVAYTQPKAAVSGWDKVNAITRAGDLQVASELARFSIVRGTPPSPVALTTWRQPWVPLWAEWRVTLEGTTTVDGWRLDSFDLEPDGPAPQGGGPVTSTLVGRSMLGAGAGESLRASVASWLASEHQRQATPGRAAYGDGAVLQQLAGLKATLDLVSASLDGVREQLLGIDYVGQVVRGEDGRPQASGQATVLFGGTMRVDAVRLVDAFGRTLSVADTRLDELSTPIELEVSDAPRTVRMRPRILGSSRWLWRLVDASQPSGTPPDALREAYVDQLEPSAAVNPVAGFLLPDHIDEALEVFTTTGDPIGQVGHDPVSGAVTWEPAPGRPVPPDAGPLVGVADQSRAVAEVAAAMVRADAEARALDVPPESSALVSLLRAVDTTLWTVDTFAAVGSGTVAGLVGRPVAVVRTLLRLDVPDDLDELTVTATGGVDARRAVFDALGDERFEIHLGSLTRTDDALLGYFVDDDYRHFHIVDKVLAAHAKDTGRNVGQLGLLGETVAPEETTLDHPYLVTDGRLLVRRGQPVMLTLLMLPNGRVHLTSGVLPRKALALADSWVTPGLQRLMPSVRVGPVLVDPAEIRLPLVSTLGERQTFTRRTGELTWKDDPILAATQTAYLPRLPHEVQEGWIRVSPAEDTGPGGTS